MKNKVGALLLAGAMMLSMSATAFAEEPHVNTTEASITKNLEFAEGITVPNATFEFTATKVTEDAPEATIQPIVYTSEDGKGELQGGKYVVSKNAAIQFGKFPHAGVYEYDVKETQDTYKDANGKVTYAQDVYHLRVYVKNKGDNLEVSSITAEKEDTKQTEILFTNTFTDTQSLSIEKKTTGDLADKTKSFEFTILFTSAATSAETEFVGKIGEEEVRCTAGTPATFHLHDGQTLTFAELPVGTRYVVTEKGENDGYTPSVKVVENGTAKPDKQGSDAEDLNSVPAGASSNLVGENENKVTFENAYREVPITGVILNNLPFIAMMGAAVAALVMLAVLKRRKAAKH